MKKTLTKTNKELYFYKNGVKKIINREDKTTYPKGLTGKISSGLTGNISGLYGNISSELTGNISELTGNCTEISGNLDDCEITDEERKKGIDISELVEEII